MARDNTTLVAYAVGGYLTYHLAITGQLGPTAKQYAQNIHDVFTKGIGSTAPKTATPPGTSSAPSPSPGATYPTWGSAELKRMVAANPNFYSQMKTWQNERAMRGENPEDWAAFREHLWRLGAPDPGPYPPPEFDVTDWS